MKTGITGSIMTERGLEEDGAAGAFFVWEEDKIFSMRESELMQQHLQKYGTMPGGGDDNLDDLF